MFLKSSQLLGILHEYVEDDKCPDRRAMVLLLGYVHIGHIVGIHFFKFLLYSELYSRQALSGPLPKNRFHDMQDRDYDTGARGCCNVNEL